MGFIKEFKEFAMKGNLIDLAVALIIGAAFGKIISALVDDVIMPIVGSFLGKSFESMITVVNGVDVRYGMFIQAFVDFLIITLVVFIMIKALNSMKKKKPTEVKVEEVSSTDKLLMEIRDSLRK